MLAREAVISLPIAQRAHMERFEATERLSELYIIEVDVICEEAEVDFLSHLGEAAQITISQDSVPLRTFSGLIFEAEFLEEVDAGYRYRLTLRPWLYALSRNVDSQIFQQKSALEIIQAVFDQRGCQDYDLTQLQKSYPQRDYCVQYRESDFTFVSRLMEQEGIYYFFDHRDGRHVMVLCDDPASHPTVLYEELAYLPAQQQAIEDRMWRWTETVSTGIENKATFRDFDFTQPTNQLQSIFTDPGPSASGGGGGGNSSGEDPRTLTAEDGPAGAAAAAHKAEIYDFPTGFLDNSRGDTLTETAVQALVAEDRTYRGIGDPVLSACGYKLNLVRHPLDRLNIAYLIVAQTYRMDSQHYVSGGDGADDEQPLVVEVVAAPAATKFRAPQLTPWPVVRGIETAIVVGPDGETIYTDDWGRVKVRFHWDRAEASADQTCWMRVAFASADNGFGHIVLPRIGQEVVVDFLNGDPDRPIVVGSVYNGDKKPAYPLADNKTMSVWRSHTIDGGADDYNEISFEDKNGDEVFNVQAQKDRKTLVKHDDTKTIKNNLTTTVQEGDEKREVSQGKRTTTVQQNEELTVNAGDMKTTVSAGNK
ncbi:MAG TPA: type VI secretion system tip protein TssI/VgrG, partial [Caulobacteraceae bacterium]|nr:type VI secretion system tip protein TssI/VgrG [Caulobacteraceae bacterium]